MSLRRFTPLLLLLLVLFGFFALRRALGLDFHPESLQQVVSGFGVWGPIVYIGIVTFRAPLGLPSGVLLVGGGLIFGTLTATLCGALGLTLSGVAAFLAARYAGRHAIESRMPERMRPLLDLAGTRLGAIALSAGTAYPFGPVTLFCLLAGVAHMALAVFVLAFGVGALGRSALYTFFGSRIMEGDLRGVLEATLLLVLSMALPLLVPRVRHWLFDAFRSRPPAEPPGSR